MLISPAYAQAASPGGGDFFISLLPMVFMSVPIAVIAYLSAKKLGYPAWLWVILSLVPLVGFFMPLYIGFKFASEILDRLDNLARHTEK